MDTVGTHLKLELQVKQNTDILKQTYKWLKVIALHLKIASIQKDQRVNLFMNKVTENTIFQFYHNKCSFIQCTAQ